MKLDFFQSTWSRAVSSQPCLPKMTDYSESSWFMNITVMMLAADRNIWNRMGWRGPPWGPLMGWRGKAPAGSSPYPLKIIRIPKALDCLKFVSKYRYLWNTNAPPPFPNLLRIGLTFDLLTWISIGIIYSSQNTYLLSLKLLGQSILELSIA